jgi:hypothetical protein
MVRYWAMDELSNLNSSISKFLKQFNVRRIKENLLIVQIWDEMVGELVSKNTNPLNFSAGVIYVEISNSAWANEMSFLKEDIIAKYNERFRKNLVKEIRFIIKRNDRNVPPVKVKSEKNEQKDQKNKVIAEQKLSSEDNKLIEEKSNELEDEELKHILKKFFEGSRKRELSHLQQGWKKCKICKCLHTEKENLCLPCRLIEGKN